MLWAKHTRYVALVGLIWLGVAGCGSTNPNRSTGAVLSPTQYDNYQQITAYVRALNKIETPFKHPPTEPTNYAKAARLLGTSLREIEGLTPPRQYRAFQEKYVRGVRGELALYHAFRRAQQTHNAVLLNNTEAKNLAAERIVREALTEGAAILRRCQADRFSC